MSARENDPFEFVILEQERGDFETLTGRDVKPVERPVALPAVTTARFHGFDLDERPMVVGLPGLPYEIVPARTTVTLLREHIGADVVVLFDGDDLRRPIVIGILQQARGGAPAEPSQLVSAQIDDHRLVLTAEREIVLRCGEASITLTRAGKVIIKGAYILSRSSGYNKIKGAAVDIN